MDEITKEEIQTLINLQKAETESVRIAQYLKDVEKEKEKLEASLAAFRKALEEHQDVFSQAEKECREIEAEIQLIDERTKKNNENLRRVKTNKEYQALQREVDDGRKRKEYLENSYLKSLEEKESREKLIKERESEYEQLRLKIRADQEEIDQKTLEDRERLKDYEQQKNEIGSRLNPDLFEKFNDISSTSQGLAVVEVKKAVCRGCFMNIPPQLYIEVQRCTHLILCPQCNRILYYKEPEEDMAGVD